jgi:hypothetical protein
MRHLECYATEKFLNIVKEGFEVASMKMAVFWVVALCNVVDFTVKEVRCFLFYTLYSIKNV